MNITEIKQQINAVMGTSINSLAMVRQLDEKDNKTEWLSYWDNEKRVRVVMHQDVFNKLMQDKQRGDLAVKRQDVAATAAKDGKEARAAYVRFVVITPNGIEGVL